MSHTLYLAWRYLAYHRIKTATLVASITLIAYLPIGLQVIIGQSARELTSRAEATPLLVGAKGSPLELVLNSLYFESDTPAITRYEEVTRIAATGLGLPIPLYVRFRTGEFPIVGTSLEYLDFRGLRVAAGRPMAVLGECVVGHAVAAELGLEPGGSLVSSPDTVFDLAGTYPLKLRVTGVLAAAHTADDRAVFVDLKTAWIIEGLGHGHQDLAKPDASSAVLTRERNRIVANASLLEYNEIGASNIGSFHFHGDLKTYPISAVIVVPRDQKSSVILRGRYESSNEAAQIAVPLRVMDELLETILTVESYVIAAFIVVGLSTLATAALVFFLSVRLRRRELQTIVKIGGSKGRIASILAAEIVFVMVSSAALGAVLTLLTSRFGSAAIRAFILS